jgi:hypothetical protein
MPREPVLVVCMLLRDYEPGHVFNAGRREFCHGCRSRVWLSQSSIDAVLAIDHRPLASCPACARAAMTTDDEVEFLEATEASVLEGAAALGIEPDEAREIARAYVEAWRRGEV